MDLPEPVFDIYSLEHVEALMDADFATFRDLPYEPTWKALTKEIRDGSMQRTLWASRRELTNTYERLLKEGDDPGKCNRALHEVAMEFRRFCQDRCGVHGHALAGS